MTPDHAKEVFTGEIFTIYQWEQEMYNGQVQVFESAVRSNTATVIAITENEQILRQIQEQPHKPAPFYSLPGGRIERGEDALEGAKRELLEETGYASDDWEELAHYAPSGKIEWTITRVYSRIA